MLKTPHGMSKLAHTMDNFWKTMSNIHHESWKVRTSHGHKPYTAFFVTYTNLITLPETPQLVREKEILGLQYVTYEIMSESIKKVNTHCRA